MSIEKGSADAEQVMTEKDMATFQDAVEALQKELDKEKKAASQHLSDLLLSRSLWDQQTDRMKYLTRMYSERVRGDK